MVLLHFIGSAIKRAELLGLEEEDNTYITIATNVEYDALIVSFTDDAFNFSDASQQRLQKIKKNIIRIFGKTVEALARGLLSALPL